MRSCCCCCRCWLKLDAKPCCCCWRATTACCVLGPSTLSSVRRPCSSSDSLPDSRRCAATSCWPSSSSCAVLPEGTPRSSSTKLLSPCFLMGRNHSKSSLAQTTECKVECADQSSFVLRRAQKVFSLSHLINSIILNVSILLFRAAKRQYVLPLLSLCCCCHGVSMLNPSLSRASNQQDGQLIGFGIKTLSSGGVL